MMDLLSYNLGGGYCHAWYARRFLSPVKVQENAMPHSGLGLGCYVQWTSPIRRYGDLQVHGAVKRYLRRQKVNELIDAKLPIPNGLTSVDLGCELPICTAEGTFAWCNQEKIDADIDYSDRIALMSAARNLQRSSQKYWLLEYVRRLREIKPDKRYNALVLGCTDPARRQYAIYIYELGFEYRYVSPLGSLRAGALLKLKVASVFPRNEQLMFNEQMRS